MLQSGVSRSELLIALDTLLRQYDHELEAQGIQPSGLRWQLRECNYSCQNGQGQTKKHIKMMEQKDSSVLDLNISQSERGLACRKIKSEIYAQEKELGSDL